MTSTEQLVPLTADTLAHYGFEQSGGNVRPDHAVYILMADENHADSHPCGELFREVCGAGDHKRVEGLPGIRTTPPIIRFGLQGQRFESWEEPRIYALTHLILDRLMQIDEQCESATGIRRIVLEEVRARLSEAFLRIGGDLRTDIMVNNALDTSLAEGERMFVVAGGDHFDDYALGRFAHVPHIVVRPMGSSPLTRELAKTYYGPSSPELRQRLKDIWLGRLFVT